MAGQPVPLLPSIKMSITPISGNGMTVIETVAKGLYFNFFMGLVYKT
jgi:hypothetical protein